MGNTIAQSKPVRQICNLSEYLYLKEVRANTGMINGKIFYNGKEYEEKEYNETFPEPKLKYKSI